MRSFSRYCLAALTLLCSTRAHAQVQFFGRVIENTAQAPIQGVLVTLQNAAGNTVGQQITDSIGRFSFTFSDQKSVRFKAEHIAYHTVLTPYVRIEGYDRYRVEVRMDASAVVLAPLEIIARDRGPTLAAFDRRRESGVGWYITRAEIEGRGANAVTDILANAPGVWFQRLGPARIAYMRANCPAMVYIDGFLINRPLSRATSRRPTTDAPIDELVKPRTVEGIEVYQSVSKVPPEFLTPEAECGVIAIWTRRGS